MNEKEIIRNGAGENYNCSQDHCFIKLSSIHTNGELCFFEDALKPGFFLPRHHHIIMTEFFYVLEVEMELIFDGESFICKHRDTVAGPPNVWHEARCEKGGKMWSISKNGRFDLYLKKLSKISGGDFAGKDLMKSFSAEFDMNEA